SATEHLPLANLLSPRWSKKTTSKTLKISSGIHYPAHCDSSIPELPGPPTATTKTPSRRSRAGRTAKSTSRGLPSSVRLWSQGTSMERQVRSESEHGFPPSSMRRSVVEAGAVDVVVVGGAVVEDEVVVEVVSPPSRSHPASATKPITTARARLMVGVSVNIR